MKVKFKNLGLKLFLDMQLLGRNLNFMIESSKNLKIGLSQFLKTWKYLRSYFQIWSGIISNTFLKNKSSKSDPNLLPKAS